MSENESCAGGNERLFQADEVREILDRFQSEGFNHTENVPDTIERFAKEVVESGTFYPDCNITAEVSLTPKERLTGKRDQDVTAMFIFGLILGTALERDVPMDTELEKAWRDGAFVLPDRCDTDSERTYAVLASDGDVPIESTTDRQEATEEAEKHLSMMESLGGEGRDYWVQINSYRHERGDTQ